MFVSNRALSQIRFSHNVCVPKGWFLQKGSTVTGLLVPAYTSQTDTGRGTVDHDIHENWVVGLGLGLRHWRYGLLTLSFETNLDWGEAVEADRQLTEHPRDSFRDAL